MDPVTVLMETDRRHMVIRLAAANVLIEMENERNKQQAKKR